VRFLPVAENCREKSRSIALASAALLQRVLSACSGGQMGETADRRWERLQLDALTMELLM